MAEEIQPTTELTPTEPKPIEPTPRVVDNLSTSIGFSEELSAPRRHLHTGTDTPRLSYNNLNNQPDFTTLDYVNKYREMISDSDLAVNDAVAVRSSVNPGNVRLTDSDINDERTWGFVGFTKDAGYATFTATVQIAGVVTGFTGLSPGADYYLSGTMGAITTTPGTYSFRVGIALSATELLIVPNKKQSDVPTVAFKTGVTTHNVATTGDQNIAHGLGVVPTMIRITALLDYAVGDIIIIPVKSFGIFNGTTVGCVYSGLTAATWGGGAISSGYIIVLIASHDLVATDYAYATVAINSTNIVLTWTKGGAPVGTANILWEALK